MTTVFLSHKSQHAYAAEALVRALGIVLSKDEFFLSEEIKKSDEWRAKIDQELSKAKCFILLYTDPQLDWSWCFYEAGVFSKMGDKSGRPIFCLHPVEVEPPSPLAHLQTIKATPNEIENWIRNALCPTVGCQQQPGAKDMLETIKGIQKLINDTSPVQEKMLKPFIWIEASWPGPGEPDWNNVNALSDGVLSAATVSIDADSEYQLGFLTPPKELLPFLRELASDAERREGRVEFWIEKFFESLREAARGQLGFQEAAYFRQGTGGILRPIVVSFTKNSSGTTCRLRVLFASAFVSPLTDNPSPAQRLSDGIRLAIRTRLEVLDPFLGRMSQVHLIARRNPVGSRVIEALDAIMQEAMSHGMRPGDPSSRLFEEPAQHEYEQLRDHALACWQELTSKAAEEDQKGTGEYPESERLLGDLAGYVEAYLDLSLPRLRELLTSSHQ